MRVSDPGFGSGRTEKARLSRAYVELLYFKPFSDIQKRDRAAILKTPSRLCRAKSQRIPDIIKISKLHSDSLGGV